MQNTLKSAFAALFLTLGLSGAPLPGAAQGGDFVGKSAGTFMVRLRGIGVIAEGSNDIFTAGGADTGENTSVDHEFTGEIDFTYFFTDNIAAELIAATARHSVSTEPALDADLGQVWLLPPTLTVQYHLMPRQRISPYVGLG